MQLVFCIKINTLNIRKNIDESIEDTKIIEIGELKDATILMKVDSLEKGLSFEIKFKE